MSLFMGPEEHAANPPSSWNVVKVGSRWALQTTPDQTFETYRSRKAAEAAKVEGHWVAAYAEEGRWYAGGTPAGWKSWEEAKAERDRNARRVQEQSAKALASMQAARAEVPICRLCREPLGTLTNGHAIKRPADNPYEHGGQPLEPCATCGTGVDYDGHDTAGTLHDHVPTVHPAYADGTYDGPVGPVPYTAPCGTGFYTADDASAHQGHCDQCAGVLEPIMRHRASALEACMRRHPSYASRR